MSYNLVWVLGRRNASNLALRTLRLPIAPVSQALCLQARTFHTTDTHRLSSNEKVSSFISKTFSGKLRPGDVTQLLSTVAKEAEVRKTWEAPLPALSLGVAGLLPFVSVPFLSIVTGTVLDGLIVMQLAYGATVLSFLGGANWGDAVRRDDTSWCALSWSVTPQLVGWAALMVPVPLGLVLTSLGLGASVTHDVLLTTYPQWLKALRFTLTGVAVTSLLGTLVLYCFE